MEPRIRYCTTEDGVRIAYCVEGDGPTTIVALPAFNESFALDHLMPVYQQFYRDMGVGRRIVRFDLRGTGLSASGPLGPSTIMAGSDASAVIRAVGSNVVLWAPTVSGPPAVRFAADHPDLVSRLILYGTFAAVTDAFPDATLDAFRNLAKANWLMGAQTIADTNGRREFPIEAGQLGDWYFQSETAEHYVARLDPWRESNRDEYNALGAIQMPTLVLHRIADPAIPFSAGQKLAAGIPGARFVPLEGKGHLFCLGDYSNILTAVDKFLGDRATASPADAASRPALAPQTERRGGVSTVLFTDIVGHTEMMQRLGDARGRDVLREHERITRDLLKQHGGAEVKTMGDGFMASFGSVTSAIECAIALQRAFAGALTRPFGPPSPSGGEGSGIDERIGIRIGLNAGEPIEEDGDLFGATVILASRIAAKAAGGEILVPDTVRGLLSGKNFLFGDRGEFVPKGFDESLRLYEVRWRESA